MFRMTATVSTSIPPATVSRSHADTVHALRTAAAHVERSLARALEPFGVTAAQYELLEVIQRHAATGGGCSELGRHLAAPGPDVTRMLDRLDAAGLVTRCRDTADRRIVHASLTDKGRELLSQVGPSLANAEEAVFDGLSSDERRHLTTLLLGVRRNCPGS
jgi:MarR family transcriptional regulator, organic hydroperoxide resistance regulator